MSYTEVPDDRPLWDALLGVFAGPAVLVGRDMDLYALLDRAPLTAEEISKATWVEPRPLAGLLAALVGAGLLAHSDGRFHLTPLAEAYLLPGSPMYFGGFLDLIARGSEMYTYEGLKKAVRDNAPQMHDGAEAFEAHAASDDLARRFTQAMHGMSVAPARVWPRRVETWRPRVMLDVGGGSGAHAIAAAEAWPDLRATVLDMPVVCEVARRNIAKHGLGDRVEAVAADMWTDPLPPADLHFYSMVFHDWPLERCRTLAERSFDSLPAGGRIAVHEMLLDDEKTGPMAVAELSLSMLFGTQGQQYSGAELAATLEAAGFVELSVTPTFGYWSLVSAVKPG